jgi:hypothetical protein
VLIYGLAFTTQVPQLQALLCFFAFTTQAGIIAFTTQKAFHRGR